MSEPGLWQILLNGIRWDPGVDRARFCSRSMFDRFLKIRPSEAKGLFPRRHSAVDKKSTTLKRRKNLFKTQQRRRKKKLEPFFSKLKVFVFKKDFFETSEKKKSLAIDFQFFFLACAEKKIPFRLGLGLGPGKTRESSSPIQFRNETGRN